MSLPAITPGNSYRVGPGRARAARARHAEVYPTPLAAIGDVAHASWRAPGRGLLAMARRAIRRRGAGMIADLWGLTAAVWFAALITAASGLVVAARVCETHPRRNR
ncbi:MULTISPECIES: hypothetical protein [unclassified Kribbella]|uniref:hypothetical protein n=1 Tax=unclassified Kribbella TaxID=2644121 RepID=UPI0034038F6C